MARGNSRLRRASGERRRSGLGAIVARQGLNTHHPEWPESELLGSFFLFDERILLVPHVAPESLGLGILGLGEFAAVSAGKSEVKGRDGEKEEADRDREIGGGLV